MDDIFQNGDSPFMTKERFSEIIEKVCIDEDLNHFQAVIAYCEDNNREFEDVVKLMTTTLLEKTKQSARDLGFMPQESAIEGL